MCSGDAIADGCILIMTNTGHIHQLIAGAYTDVSPTSPITSPYDSQITSDVLGGITYVNFPDKRPYYRFQPTDGAFSELPDWDTNDTCKSLRTFKDYLVAINVTKSTVNYSGMVKWSDTAQFGSPPANWDTTSPSSNAGETTMNDLKGPLIDGAVLGDTMFLYGGSQVFRMDFIGQPFIFRFSKLFNDVGAMALNCVTEVDGYHYVFGRDDIYRHNGVFKESIADGLIRKSLFREIDYDLSDRCFVVHNHIEKELWFCYATLSDEVAWYRSGGCNKAAVYNYVDRKWSFIDLPALISAMSMALPVTLDWTSVGSWNEIASTWLSFVDIVPKTLVVMSRGNAAVGFDPKPMLVDEPMTGLLSNPVYQELYFPAFVERLNTDLDELGAPLLGRKLVRSAVPQYITMVPSDKLVLNVGASKGARAAISWGTPTTFTNDRPDKHDCRLNDRYLSLRMDIPQGSYAEISGIDLDVTLISGR